MATEIATQEKRAPTERYVDWRLELHRLTDGQNYELLDAATMKACWQKGITPAQFLAHTTHPRAPLAQAILAGHNPPLKPPYPKAMSDRSLKILLACLGTALLIGIAFYLSRH